MKVRKILFMWISLKLMTGLGAGLGAIALQDTAPMIFTLIQGIAAGAMLTVIAETMLPETFIKGAE